MEHLTNGPFTVSALSQGRRQVQNTGTIFMDLIILFMFFRRQRVDTGNISIFSLSTHKSKCARMVDWLN